MISVIDDPLPGLAVRQENGTKWWCVLEDYTFRIVVDDVPYAFVIPKHYRYDRSSIPDWLEWLVSKDDLGCLGCLIHDLICSCRGWAEPYTGVPRRFTRAEANLMFYQVMLRDRVKVAKAKKAYWAVSKLRGEWK